MSAPKARVISLVSFELIQPAHLPFTRNIIAHVLPYALWADEADEGPRQERH